MEPTTRYSTRIVLACLLVLGCAVANAAPGDTQSREIERLVADHPRKAMVEAEAWLAEAARTRNKALGLKAQRTLALVYETLEDSERLRQAVAQGLALARETGNLEAEAELTAARAAAEALDGNYPEAARLYESASRQAEAPGLESVGARINIGKGHVFLTQGRIAEALAITLKSFSHFESRKDPYGMANSMSSLAHIYSRESASVSDLMKAADYHQRSLDLSGSGVGRSDRATDYFNLGSVHLRLKSWDRARSYFEKSLVLSKELEDTVGIAYAHHRLGVLERNLDRLKEALSFQDQALLVFKDTGDRALEFRAHLERSDVLARLDRRRESLDALALAQALADRLKSPHLVTLLHEVSGGIHARFGEYEKAYRHLLLLQEAQQRQVDVARSEQAVELQARFDTQQKEADNELLRSRELESEARRLALVLALILSLVVLGGLAFALATYVMRHRRMASLAMRDELTGIPNRRSISEYGRLQVRRARKGGEGLVVALIDIDHFKSINDELGHAVGDIVLRSFAEHCTKQLRTQDQLGRFGGEEFLLVMPGGDVAQVPYVFERLRRALNEADIPGYPRGRPLTFSLGAAEVRSVADDLEGLIQRADRALYRAKEAGRDRFESG